MTQNIFYLQTIKHTGTAVRRIFHIDGNIKSPKADAQVDKESRQHVLTSSDFNGVSEIKRESDFDAKTKIVGIKFQYANWLALSHIMPDIKSYIPLGSYGCGKKKVASGR